MAKTRQERHDELRDSQLATHNENVTNVPPEITASTTTTDGTLITLEQAGSQSYLTIGKQTLTLDRESTLGLLRAVQKVASVL